MNHLHRGDTIVFATHNAAKIRELDEMLAPFRMTVAAASALGLPEPEETGLTFEENAIIKAVAAATASGKPSLADDSGIAVDALGGEPGIYSARWAGPNKDFAGAMQTIENELEKAGANTPDKRAARFIAVLCLAFPDGSTQTFRGEVEGTLVWPPRGPNGFGYDPMFVPTGHDRTFGEMADHEKAQLSHRARAFQAFAHAVLK
ncbi:MAG TPA: RdgB/HAM1 family non-canonical purine NTP pyrophosphatase [Bauldia sp.]|nr:RdgB/HAM1 family non-canonical purine NTP pyrophosphatase [Bauldia sp.]